MTWSFEDWAYWMDPTCKPINFMYYSKSVNTLGLIISQNCQIITDKRYIWSVLSLKEIQRARRSISLPQLSWITPFSFSYNIIPLSQGLGAHSHIQSPRSGNDKYSATSIPIPRDHCVYCLLPFSSPILVCSSWTTLLLLWRFPIYEHSLCLAFLPVE